ncbi:MAG: DNA polymerase III subunit beta [Gallionellales bacterium RIFCSPLOWO2_02_FULL_57_47]|nr:MAG: DNA polymerase III subunit beta [Gallionellales bacterium RIFCSPLOWO2_02_FULL_57_47]OGT17055.1 MAG: DNA polymerase III subunit beta [Gallionellales bacterium RIFCSPHIGHO2_02_FULL_57_16]
MFIDKTEKETILKPLQVVIGIVERKQTLPILSNVLIEKDADKIRFTATDLEIQISTNINKTSSDQETFAITVGGKKIQDILRILPDQSQVSVEIKENKAIIKYNKSKFSLQTLPAQDFPKLSNQLENAKKIVLSQTKLKNLLESVHYAMAQQDVRYYLNGVLLIIDNDKLKVVATDGHRLAYNEGKIEGKHEKTEIILPRKAVAELCKLLSDSEDIVELEFTSQQVKAVFSDVVLVSKVIEGKFPDYERVIPKYTNQLIMDRTLIQQALQRAAILSNEKFRGVRFVLTEKNLSIISSNSEQEEAQEEIETEYHGEALDIGFNINYLLDGLNNIESGHVVLSFGDPNSSILITHPENKEFRYVVMPMRI